MGIHTGEVLVGPNAGPEGVRGEIPNLAQRLQAAARGPLAGENPILLSQATLQLVRDVVEVDSVGHLKLEGCGSRSRPTGCSASTARRRGAAG